MDLSVFILKDLGPGLVFVGGWWSCALTRPATCEMLLAGAAVLLRMEGAGGVGIASAAVYVRPHTRNSAALTGSVPSGYGFTCCCDVRL
jgi:hypothetical protein